MPRLLIACPLVSAIAGYASGHAARRGPAGLAVAVLFLSANLALPVWLCLAPRGEAALIAGTAFVVLFNAPAVLGMAAGLVGSGPAPAEAPVPTRRATPSDRAPRLRAPRAPART